MDKAPNIRQGQVEGFRWDGVEPLAYKEEGSAPFKAITRQVLFQRPELQCELRYFEMEAGGHSTLERHEHAHAVMIFRGRGMCLRGRRSPRGRRSRPCVHPADDMASVPREQGRAVRLSLHGECDARQAAASGRCAVGELKKNASIARFPGWRGRARPGLSSIRRAANPVRRLAPAWNRL